MWGNLFSYATKGMFTPGEDGMSFTPKRYLENATGGLLAEDEEGKFGVQNPFAQNQTDDQQQPQGSGSGFFDYLRRRRGF